MFRLLVVCLLWLSGVYGHGMHMHMPAHMEMGKSAPCPPLYHGIVYAPQESHPPAPIVVKAPEPMAYLKKELAIHQMPNQIQYIHQPPYQPIMHKPMVTYIQSAVHQVHQPMQSVVKPYMESAPQHKVVYQKPMYITPVYHKPMVEPMPKIYVKKFEQPITQVVYQKPMMYKPIHPQPVHIAPIHYQAPKIVHVQQPQISYVKFPQIQLPMIHPAPVIHQAPAHVSVQIGKAPEVKPCP